MKPSLFISLMTLAISAGVTGAGAQAHQPRIPPSMAIDAKVHSLMTSTRSNGVAVAIIAGGKVQYVQAYGIRNATGQPLTTSTVMYGASITKAVFAYLALQQVDAGKIKLDTPIAEYLAKPLPDYGQDPDIADAYGPYTDLAGDDRWRMLTIRRLLDHSSGFANYAALEPDHKLRFHWDPGTRYAYSGEGIVLAQFVLEHGAGLDLKALSQADFDRLGMKRTGLLWRGEFDDNFADGWDSDGDPHPRHSLKRIRASGSMATTITDMATFAAALVRGDGLSPAMRSEMVKVQMPITTESQFATLADELPAAQRRKGLASGLGVIVFDGPQGHGFTKGGHDNMTGNSMICIERGQRCVVILSNDVRSEIFFPDLVRFILGDIGAPYDWIYGGEAGKS